MRDLGPCLRRPQLEALQMLWILLLLTTPYSHMCKLLKAIHLWKLPLLYRLPSGTPKCHFSITSSLTDLGSSPWWVGCRGKSRSPYREGPSSRVVVPNGIDLREEGGVPWSNFSVQKRKKSWPSPMRKRCEWHQNCTTLPLMTLL